MTELDPATIRTHLIRTAPDRAIRRPRAAGGDPPDAAAVWAEREGITALTEEELTNERIRRAECEALNRRNLPAVLASVPRDEPFIPSEDTRALRSLINWLWTKDYARMHMTIGDLNNERRRRGLPTPLD